MKETELNKVLNYMKQYVENKYEHDSEPMLTYKDLQLVLEEIERLNNKEEQIIRRLEDLIIIGEQVENEWAVDICKMIIEELKGDSSNE